MNVLIIEDERKAALELQSLVLQIRPQWEIAAIIPSAADAIEWFHTVEKDNMPGLIFTDNGSAYISPVSPEYPDVHMVYYVKDIPFTQPTLCGVKDVLDGPARDAGNRVQTTLAGDCQLRNYRLAVAATGEYTAWAGGLQAQALVYIGTLVNAYLAQGGRAVGVKAGETYMDVGTLDGYRTAMRMLARPRPAHTAAAAAPDFSPAGAIP